MNGPEYNSEKTCIGQYCKAMMLHTLSRLCSTEIKMDLASK